MSKKMCCFQKLDNDMKWSCADCNRKGSEDCPLEQENKCEIKNDHT